MASIHFGFYQNADITLLRIVHFIGGEHGWLNTNAPKPESLPLIDLQTARQSHCDGIRGQVYNYFLAGTKGVLVGRGDKGRWVDNAFVERLWRSVK